MNQFKFWSIKVRDKKNTNQPDYSSIIKINNTHFTLTGWVDQKTENINYILEAITNQRLNNDKFLLNKFKKYKAKYG